MITVVMKIREFYEIESEISEEPHTGEQQLLINLKTKDPKIAYKRACFIIKLANLGEKIWRKRREKK